MHKESKTQLQKHTNDQQFQLPCRKNYPILCSPNQNQQSFVLVIYLFIYLFCPWPITTAFRPAKRIECV